MVPGFVEFGCDAEVEAIGRGLMDRSLPKPAWTHAAHFASALYLLRLWPQARVSREMPGLIRAYNEATGVANTADSGFHATITEASIRAAARFAEARPGEMLFAVCNALMAGELGDRDWMLRYWSRERLFSAQARLGWCAPDPGGEAAIPF